MNDLRFYEILEGQRNMETSYREHSFGKHRKALDAPADKTDYELINRLDEDISERSKRIELLTKLIGRYSTSNQDKGEENE